MRMIHDVYKVTLDWGDGQVEELTYHLPSARLFGHSWLLEPLEIPTKRTTIQDVTRLINQARKFGAQVEVTEPWPPAFML